MFPVTAGAGNIFLLATGARLARRRAAARRRMIASREAHRHAIALIA